jgi:hypothetical protein
MSNYCPVDTVTRVEIEQLISEMLYRLDHNQADTTWELYTEDGVSVGPLGTMNREQSKAWNSASDIGRLTDSGDLPAARSFLSLAATLRLRMRLG